MALLICSEDEQPLRIDVSTTKASPYISIIVHGQVNEWLYVVVSEYSSDGGKTLARLHKMAECEK